MTGQNHIERIDALIRNARNTWFALLGVLVFVGITLMGVEHIDFYGVGRATKLPLVDVSVPTRYFFVAAPILTAAIYGYFHLYLIRLWDALSAAPPHVDDIPLGDAISPWLVSDAALHWRNLARGDQCTTPYTMVTLAALLNLALAFSFGIGILAWLWWASMPAHSFWITGLAGGISLLVSVLTGMSSFASFCRRRRQAPVANERSIWATIPQMSTFLVLIPFVCALSFQRTAGPNAFIVAMRNENIVEQPTGWLPYEIAYDEFRASWCKREKFEACEKLGVRHTDFYREWNARRAAALSDLKKPKWHKNSESNLQLRGAALSGAFLAGAAMKNADLQNIDLIRANFEGANLIGSNLQGAVLRSAKMQRSLFWRTNLHRATLEDARVRGAEFWLTNLTETVMRYAHMPNASLYYSRISGTPDHPIVWDATDVRAVVNQGSSLRFADLRGVKFDMETDFRNAFLDGSVLLSPEFRNQMGNPCQWVSEPLTDQEFFGRWRGWVEAPGYFVIDIVYEGQHLTDIFEKDGRWSSIAPPGFENVTPIPPPEGCNWKNGPMPASTDTPD